MREHWTIWVCPDCGSTNMHADTCGAFPGEPVMHGNRVDVVAREALEEVLMDLRKVSANCPHEVTRAIQTAETALGIHQPNETDRV